LAPFRLAGNAQGSGSRGTRSGIACSTKRWPQDWATIPATMARSLIHSKGSCLAGHVTEREIFSLLKGTFRRAAEHCDKLAVVPARGPVYQALREDLQIGENCCRQIGYYREHANWFTVGLFLAEVHRRAGGWLRDRSMPRTATSNLAHPLFLKLAEKLRYGAEQAQRLETQATGKVGMILPEPQRPPIRTQSRMVQVPSGLIIPRDYAA
jgi:hypothetical protein